LSVGQCAFDHRAITRHLERTFGAEVFGADSFDEAIEAIRSEPFALVLVNRISDLDGAPGLDLIRRLKADPRLALVPVMLVSNYPDAQREAEALGALPGFGKSDLRAPGGTKPLQAVLGDDADPE
jgi:two-component system chemotaxis response regulator CheY